ncbi:unnamed protein product [Microthlaspi erraticum]|uniref:Kri1-like C-terminal domain-containing protein n=1 Tax=Microthlaspi erraticum TaxID=1685480 RepID=A0A6D2K0D2_9BRAS|nr:unnamed protein product [Microthlaspi erraticum]
MGKSFLGDDGDDSPLNNDPLELEVDEDYALKLAFNREREDRQKYDEMVKGGRISKDDDELKVEDSDEEAKIPEMSDPEDDRVDLFDKLVKYKRREYPAKVEVNKEDGEEKKKKRRKKKKNEEEGKEKMYLKDVQARQLLENGPEFDEEDEERIQTRDEEQEALRQAVADAVEAGGSESDDDSDDDGDDLLRVKEGDDLEVDDEEVKKKADEYFGDEAELDEGNKFLRDYFLKQMWKEKEGKIDQAELDQLEEEFEEVNDQENYELKFRHQEKNAEETVMGHSRIVEGSVRKKDSSRKTQRKNKEAREKMAEIERQEEVKRLKNVMKKEINEKMKRVLAVAGFKEGDEIALGAKDLDDEFDPVKYDEMMKALYDEKYYGAEDDGMRSDEDDEKPDFDKEDELLGLPKNWGVIQSGDGFEAAKEKVSKLKENVSSSDEEEVEEEVEEVEGREGKRKRKQKISLVKRVKEELMDEYYKLDYEGTIDDLKTRFKFAKVQPNSYGLKTSDILVLDDSELNQFVPLKKMAPFVEKDWEVNKYKLKEQKMKIREVYQRIRENNDEKRSKKRKKSDVVEKTKPAPVVEEEVEEDETKLSKKAKRRRREAEKKLPANRMVAYGKTPN